MGLCRAPSPRGRAGEPCRYLCRPDDRRRRGPHPLRGGPLSCRCAAIDRGALSYPHSGGWSHLAAVTHIARATNAISALEPLVTLAVVAASLCYPAQARVAVGRLIGPILVEAGMHAGFARRFVGVFRRDRLWERRAWPQCCGAGSRRGRGQRRSSWSAIGLAELLPVHP